MYCTRCGREIPAGAKYCTGCGAQVGRVKKCGATGESAFGKFRENARVLKNCSTTFVGAILGLLACIFFVNAGMFKASYEAFSGTQTITVTMFQDKGFLKAVFVLVYIVAAGLMLAPLFTEREWRKWSVWPSIVVPVFAILVLVLVTSSAKNYISDDKIVQYLMEAMNVEVKMAAPCWLFIGVNAFTVIMGLMTTSAIGDALDLQEQLREAERQENGTTKGDEHYWCAACGEEGPFKDGCPKCGSNSKAYVKIKQKEQE